MQTEPFVMELLSMIIGLKSNGATRKPTHFCNLLGFTQTMDNGQLVKLFTGLTSQLKHKTDWKTRTVWFNERHFTECQQHGEIVL